MSGIDFEIFRYNLKTLRKVADKTAKEVSEELKLKQQKRISDIEEGRGKPSFEEINTICEYFKVSIDAMIKQKANIKIEFI